MRDRGEVVVKCGAQELTRECMVKLYHKQWLNDQVINGYIQHGLSRRDEVISKRGGGPRSWFLSSFFVSALLQTRHPRASKNGRAPLPSLGLWLWYSLKQSNDKSAYPSMHAQQGAGRFGSPRKCLSLFSESSDPAGLASVMSVLASFSCQV